jgi:hypothetical protein
MMRGKRMLGLALSAVALFTGAQASAALLTIGTGTPFLTPSNNDTIGALVPLIDGATLITNQANVILQFRYLGSESGYANKLVVTGLSAYGPLTGNFTHTEAANNNTNPMANFPGTFVGGGLQAAAGGVGMLFDTQTAGTIGLGPIVGGKSIALAYLDVGCTTDATKKIKDCVVGTQTNAVLFALDDSGGNPNDDNHDDYVGYMVASPVPLPAAFWLLGSGLLGLLGIARRRSA